MLVLVLLGYAISDDEDVVYVSAISDRFIGGLCI